MAARTNVYVPPMSVAPLEAPGYCELCREVVWARYDGRLVHPCCLAWRAQLEEGKRCPSCESADKAAEKWRQRQAMEAKRRRKAVA